MWTKRSIESVRRAWIVVSLAAASLLGQGCSHTVYQENGGGRRPTGQQSPLRIALPREPLSALLALAVVRGYLAGEGVAAEIIDGYPSGRTALAGLLAGEVDIALCAETPIVFESFERTDFRIVATVGSSDNEPRIVARIDHGIEDPADLRGKRVATQRASAVHYFLYLFLLRHGMSEADVELSFINVEKLPLALTQGSIDAFSMREPFVGKAEQMLGEKAIVFAEPALYVKTYNLVVREDILTSRPETLGALLRALLRAEQFARANPRNAMEAVAERLAMDRAVLDKVWPELELRVSLGQGLLSILEDQARWALSRGLIRAEQVPNYLEFVDSEPLTTVKSAAVTLIR